MPGFPAGFLTLLLASTNTNEASTTPELERTYCPIECLDKKAAMDAAFFFWVGTIAVIIIPLLVQLVNTVGVYELKTKRLIQELALTPKSKRDIKLEKFCNEYKVEYMEVEDDGPEIEKKYGKV
jgi:hypothetical protein